MSKSSPRRTLMKKMRINHLKSLNVKNSNNKINNLIMCNKIKTRKVKKISMQIRMFVKFCTALRDLINRITNRLNRSFITGIPM